MKLCCGEHSAIAGWQGASSADNTVSGPSLWTFTVLRNGLWWKSMVLFIGLDGRRIANGRSCSKLSGYRYYVFGVHKWRRTLMESWSGYEEAFRLSFRPPVTPRPLAGEGMGVRANTPTDQRPATND